MNFTLISAVMPKAWIPRKLLLVMKLTTFLLIAVFVQASAKGYGQKISLNATNTPLANVFSAIKQQSGYAFLYTDQNLDHQKITIRVTNADINETLKACFQNLNIDYKIVDKNILLKIKEQPVAKSNIVAAPIIITGKVTDEHGDPLPGVNIRVKGTNLGYITYQNGTFSVLVPTPDAVLQFTFIGYLTQEIRADQLKKTAVIVMKEDLGKLDEVQVIGYGTTTKRTNTGDITTIDAKTIAQYPVTNVLDVLQGTVPGLAVYKNTGSTTGTYKVQLRGINGLSAGSPLYVVDGVIMQGGSWNSRNSTSGVNSANGGLPGVAYDIMSLINPDDIEGVSVLKDADATAIYGSRGADGVILITTKKGKSGAPKIDANIYSGVTDVPHQVPMLNLQQYLQMRHEAKANDHSAITATDYDINGVWDTTRNTNWQKTLLGGFGHNTNAHLGISGGSEQVTYRISGGYKYITNLEPLGGSDKSANLNVNLNSTTRDKKFSVSFTGGYLYDINTMPQIDLTGNAISLAPDAPALYTPAGALNYQNNTFGNPLVVRNYLNSAPQNNLTSSLILSYKPVTDLEIKLTSGYNKQSLNEFLGSPTSASPPYLVAKSSSSFTYNNQYSWSIEPQINYTRQLGKGKILATIGASLQNQSYSSLALSATGYSSDLLLASPTAGTSITSYLPYFIAPQKHSALFGRINYSWADKYYIDLSGRDDGSSNFGQNRQFHMFTAAGAGWIFSEEGFVKDHLPFLSFGKLRGSYGSTGRDNISPYSYLSTYSSYNVATAYSGVAGYIPTRLPNPDLSWETTKKGELGLELQFLKGRISFETNFYRNHTTGLLGNSVIPSVTGFNTITSNMPATVQNQGFDASLTTTNIKSKNLSWVTTILFTRDRNKLIDYPNLANSPYANIYVIGQPVNLIKVYSFGGVNPQTGINQIYAANGSLTSTPDPIKDKTVLINTNPDFYGSIQNNITYKQFNISFLFRYIKQIGRNEFYNIGPYPPGFFANSNYSAIVLNRWQKPGDITNIQRYSTNINYLLAQSYAVQSTAAYGDASYIRLQNLSLSYTLPQIFTHKLGMESLQVFLLGDNLWTITGYNGLDPETQSISSLPTLRTITAGLRLTL